ncbi:HAD family hydrolase [uncultured Ruminococcus sp.]|uniref:HAD family hydrolase n=1 Tax=uncultured Ruminococcus sp. TaxID=165186 RepID=UPI0025D1D058|nr:HAD family hydrolase [uncultured Ruminococcus sp.]
MSKTGIIFDLDGTLWNTSETIVPIWNEVLKSHSETDKQLTVTEMNGYMGKTLEQIARLMLPKLDLENAMAIVYECCDVERDYLRKVGGKLYDNLAETLKQLKEKHSLYIVSNCQDGYVQAFLDFHGFNEIFDDFEMSGRTKKSKGENIKLIIERNNLDKAVYVGDTQGDYDAAKAAGVPFVFAEYGFGSIDSFEYSIEEFYRLPSVAEQVFLTVAN